MLANVAGDETGQRIRQHLAAWQPLFEEVAPAPRRQG